MKTKLKHYLITLQDNLIAFQLWSAEAPHHSAFESEQPFCIDTMNGEEWLQWVFIPRMRALIESNSDLPTNFSLTPYFEEVFKEHPNKIELLASLKQIDNLCKEGS